MGIRALAKDSVIYGAGGAVTKFVALLTFPLYASVLSRAEFARQDLVLSFFVILVIVSSVGVDYGYTRLFHDREGRARAELASNAFYIPVAVALLLAAASFVARGPLSVSLNRDPESAALFGWGAIYLTATVAMRPHQLTLRLRRQPRRFVVHAATTALAHIALVLLCVRAWGMGAEGVLAASAGSAVVSMLVAMLLCGWVGRVAPDLRAVREMVGFGVPLLISGVALWVFSSWNKFLVQHLAGPDATAVYGVAQRIAAMIGILLYGFQMAWAPIAYAAIKNPAAAADFFARVSQLFWWAGCSGVLALGLFSGEVVVLLSKFEYAEARLLVPLLAMGTVLYGYLYIVSIGFQYAKKTWHQLAGVGLGCAVMLAVSAAALPSLGLVGAAAAVTAGFAVAVAYCMWASGKYLKVDYRVATNAAAALAVVCLAVQLQYRMTPAPLSGRPLAEILLGSAAKMAFWGVGVAALFFVTVAPAERKKLYSVLARLTPHRRAH